MKQIQNFVDRWRKKNASNKPVTDVDLQNYADANSAIPADENSVYVVGFAPFDKNKHFLVVWSTSKLVRVQAGSNLLCTDATYKLNWQVYNFVVYFALV